MGGGCILFQTATPRIMKCQLKLFWENVGLLVISNAMTKKVGIVPHIYHASTWEAWEAEVGE